MSSKNDWQHQNRSDSKRRFHDGTFGRSVGRSRFKRLINTIRLNATDQ